MKNIFLNCGAHKGESTKFWLEKYGRIKEWEIHSFEANPALWDGLEKTDGTLYKSAVWIYDGVIDLYRGKYSAGSTVMQNKISAELDYTKPVQIPCIDFSRWVKENFSRDDFIAVKMDIEGAEFEVIPHLIKTEAIQWIDEMYVEFHPNKISDVTTTKSRELEDKLSKMVSLYIWQ